MCDLMGHPAGAIGVKSVFADVAEFAIPSSEST
jgi:hypothetical protein